MDNRYKIVISSRTIYREIELSPSAKQLKIGTDMDCDVRLHKSLFFGRIELLFTKVNEEWSLLCSDNLYITVGDIRKMVTKKLHNGDALEIKYFDSDNTVFSLDFLIDFDDGHIRYERIIDTSYQPEIRIGCASDNTVVIKSPYVKDDRIVLSRYGENYTIRIDNASYGVLHNGKQAESGELVKNGDFISISDFFFCLKDGRLWTQIRQGMEIRGVRYTDKPEQNGYPKFIRNTRVKTVVNQDKIEILDPPTPPEKPKNDIFTRLLPSAGMLAVAFYMASKGGTMVIMSLMSAGISIVTGVMAFISGKKEYKVKTAERIETYTDYIERKRESIAQLREQEQEQMSELYISQADEIERFEQFSSSLFDRRTEDEDFLCIRLGTGKVIAKRSINYKKQEKLEVEDGLQVLPAQICESFRYLENAPVVCPLKNANAIGIVGQEAFRFDFLKNIVVDIVARQYESDVKMAFVAEPENKERIYPFRFLPQVQCEDIGSRLIVTNGESKNVVFEYLYKELTLRKQNKTAGQQIVVFLYDEFGFQNHPISRFVNEAASLGVTFVFFAESASRIPMGCSYIVEIRDAQNAALISTKDRNDALEFEYPRISEQEVQAIVDLMAPVYTEELSLEGSLTKNYSMFQMLNILAVDDLDIGKRWAGSNVTKSLAAPIGISKSNMIYLDLHDKAHGPHGLVAGTTGSGKSEVLQTYILAMATLYHPYEVGFVIIDFKGGGMVNQFRKLPHLVGAITNIDGKEINRSLKSIKAELQKRQRLFAEADVNHIDKYIGKYKKGEVSVPLPHLIIIVDEFAELKAEQPEFMKELISAARIGRSLGVHLILATQKPSGQVNEQIWSNSRFKLCLKVQTPEDSNEMLKSPLAAEIKEPGRAYLQVGNNEIFELFQSAYSGAPERTDGANVKAFSIYSLDESGKRTPVYVQKKGKAVVDGATQLDAIVKYISAYCAENCIAALPPINLPALEERIVYKRNHQANAFNGAVIVPLGIFDDPDNQRQETCYLNLTANNTFIVGSAQTGKTNILQQIIHCCAEQYTSEQINFYILDFSSMILKNLEPLKHVGGVVFANEDEKMKNFMKMMLSEITKRKQVFADCGLTSFLSYYEAGYRDMPQIVVLLDNFIPMKELFSEYEDAFLTLCRDGLTLGISVVIANTQSTGLGYKLMSNFAQRVCLHCNDSGEYSLVFDHCRMEPSEYAGRGLIQIDKQIYEFQSFLSFDGKQEIDRVLQMRQFVEECNRGSEGKPARMIPTIPNLLTAAYMEQQYGLQKTENYEVRIGLEYEQVTPFALDISRNPVIAIGGRNGYGKRNMLRLLMQHLQANLFTAESEVYLIDSLSHQLECFRGFGITQQYTIDPSKVISTVEDVHEELVKRFNRVCEEGTECMQYMPLLVLIISNAEAIQTLSKDAASLNKYKEIVGKYAGLKVCVIYSDFPNNSIGFNSPEIFKMIKENHNFFYFDDLKTLKTFDIGMSAAKKFKKEITPGICYHITNDTVEKIKTIKCDGEEAV